MADAIRDHYKPVGQGDDVPTAPVTVAVSLADKLDTIVQFFSKDMKPTGSKDPFALRRAALGVIAILKANGLRMAISLAAFENLKPDSVLRIIQNKNADMADVITKVMDELGPEAAIGALKAWLPELGDTVINAQMQAESGAQLLEIIPVCAGVRDFILERLEVSEREVGVAVDILRAAKPFDGGFDDDLVRLLARVHALQAFVATDDGKNLLAGYKRAANILKAESKTGWDADATNAAPEPAEAALIAALAHAAPQAEQAVAAEDFAGAMAALASLRAPIDAFFDGDESLGFAKVTVNDADPAKRAARLALLDRFRAAVHNVADFSRIEG